MMLNLFCSNCAFVFNKMMRRKANMCWFGYRQCDGGHASIDTRAIFRDRQQKNTAAVTNKGKTAPPRNCAFGLIGQPIGQALKTKMLHKY
jgi:hypothetical protein